MERGHGVIRIRSLIVNLPNRSTPDDMVARISDSLGGIWVTNNTKHFKGMGSHDTDWAIPPSRLRRFHRLLMRCKESRMRARLEELLPTIEHEFEQYQRRSDKRMNIEVGESYWRSNR